MSAPVSSARDDTASPILMPVAQALVRPLWRRLLLSAGLGGLAGLAFAPVHAVPLLWLCFPGLVLLIDQARTPRGVAATTGAFAFGHFCASIFWVAESFSRQSSVPQALAPAAVLALALLLALFYALPFGLARRYAWPARRGDRLILMAGLWALAEWLRGHVFTGFPWNPLAAVWTVSDLTLQPLAYLGTWGLSLVTVWAAMAPAALLPPHRPRALMAGGTGLALLAIVMVGGAARLPAADQPVHDDLVLRLVQPDIPQEQKWQRSLRGRHFARHLAMSETSADIDGRFVVIWSESAVPYFLDQDPGRRQIIAGLLPDNGVLLTGQLRYSYADSEDEDGRYYNALVAIGDEGGVLDVYDKAHLVPFGEYIPLHRQIERAVRWVVDDFDFSSFAYGRISMAAGPHLRTLDVAGLPPFSPLICYEGIFPGQVVGRGVRPQWLLNVSNDAWFGDSWGPYQHFALSRMRAVEEGVPLVRVAGRGISAIIDPYGRIVRRTGLLERTTLTGGLPLPLKPPPAASISPGGAGLGLAIFVAFWAWRARRTT